VARQRELLVQQQMASIALHQQIQAIQQLTFSNPQIYGNSYDSVIQQLQLQLYQLQNSPESQQLPVYQQLLAQALSSGQVTPSPSSLPSSSGSSNQLNRSSPSQPIRGQLRIDQLFAPSSRTLSTSSKKQPKQEPT
jgi:hypothetical protein